MQLPRKNQSSILIFLLSFLLAAAAVYTFSDKVQICLNALFAQFGFSFSQRSSLIQRTTFFAVVFAAAWFLSFLWKYSIKHENKRFNTFLVILLLAAVIFMLADLCFTQSLRRDDYWEIHDAHKYGFPGYIRFEFSNFCGRFFSLFLKSLYQFFDPCAYINTLLFLNLILLIAGCIFLVSDFFEAKTPFLSKICGGVLLALALVFMSPNLWEVWFWGSGTFVYGTGITIAIWVLSFYQRCCKGKVYIFPTLLIIFLGCGCSELTTASICAFGAIFLITERFFGKEKRWNKHLLLYTGWSWLCTLLNLTFSANASFANNKYYTQTVSNGIIKLAAESIKNVFSNLWAFGNSRIEYLLSFMLIAFILGMVIRPVIPPLRKWGVFCLLLFLTGCGALFINATLNYIPPRVLSIPLDWIFLILSGSCALAGNRLSKKITENLKSTLLLWCLTVGCLIFCAFYKGNIQQARDIRTAWEYRDAILTASSPAVSDDGMVHTCMIPVLGSYHPDPGPDPNDEFNIVTAYYYGFDAIIGDELCPPFNLEK